eukprot:gene1330-11412_t
MWEEVEAVSTIKPTERRRTSMTSYENVIYIFGGYNDNGYLAGFFSFDTLTNHWKEIKLKEQPYKRSGHSMLTLNDDIYLVGGETMTLRGQAILLNDIWKYSIKKNYWKEIEAKNEFSFNTKKPSPRFFHSLCKLFNNYLIVFGGFNRTQAFNDFYYFDIETLKWDTISLKEQYGHIPKPMLSHSSTSYLNSVYIYGGEYFTNESITKKQNLYEFNFYTKFWKKYDLKTLPPRSNTVMLTIQKSILFFGGFDEEAALNSMFNPNDCHFYNDLHIYNVDNGKLKEIQNLSDDDFPNKRTKHSGAIVGEKMYIFGGISSHSGDNLNDLCFLKIPKEFTDNYDNFSSELIGSLKNGNFNDLQINLL